MTHKLWTIQRILRDLLGISEEEIGEGFSLRHPIRTPP